MILSFKVQILVSQQKKISMLESEKFMHRCIELIKNVNDLSEEMLTIMFMQYKRLIESEIKEKNKTNKYGTNGTKN